MATQKKPVVQFAICLDNHEYPASLELYKVYRLVPDPDAEKEGDLRVIDESGEDYLYPAAYFLVVTLSREKARTLTRALTASGQPPA
jgi:hypothetical protein